MLALILLLSAGGLYHFSEVLFPDKSEGETSLSSKPPMDVDSALNKHLRETNSILERQRFKREIENSFTLPRVGSLVRQKKEEAGPLELEKVNRYGSGDTEGSTRVLSPSEVIQNELAQKQEQERLDRLTRQEYIRQFQLNAKAHGWNVEVDPSGVIRHVTPVPETPKYPQEGDPESHAAH